MKISKKAIQKNFAIDTDFYTESDLSELEKHGFIEFLYGIWVVYASFINEIKIKLIGGRYMTVAMLRDSDSGLFLHIKL